MAMLMPGTSPQGASREPATQHALSNLSGAIESLRMSVGELGKKLEPVMRGIPPTAPNNAINRGEGPSCPLSDTIRVVIATICEIEMQVSGLKERLEI